MLILCQILAGQAGPLSERVIFVAKKNGLEKLYICRPDGRDLRQLSHAPGRHGEPCFSEALQRFFFTRPNGQRSDICSITREGDDFRVEVNLKAQSQNPSISPDGKTLVFSTNVWGAFELAQIDLRSKKLKRLTYDQSINTYPRYSPDGKQIVFLSRKSGSSELYLLTDAQSHSKRLTHSTYSKGPASWSPSGHRLVATERVPLRSRRALFELDLESGVKRYLLPKKRNIDQANYSVDGARVLFLENKKLQTIDPADFKSFPFPLKGQLSPRDAIWVEFPFR